MEDENDIMTDIINEESKFQNSISNNTTSSSSNIDTSENNINNQEKSEKLINLQTKESKFIQLKNITEDSIRSSTKRRRNSALIRQLVSKDKNRFCYDEFDLDLTYITPNIIAMGKPSVSIEGMYRNKLEDVKEFFNQRHPQHYKVYNLCEQIFYPDKTFYAQGHFPFQDHEAPPLNLIRPFCEDAKKFLEENNENIVAIHCKAGKGRTGTFISCLLLYLNIFDNAADCLKYYGMMRVENGRGVTVPSQIRYVFYFEQILKKNIPDPIVFKKLCITKVRMVTVPNIFSVKSGCTPTFSIENSGNKWELNEKKRYDGSESFVDFPIGDSGFDVCGDVKITFYHYPVIGSKDKIFKLWFNTNFIPDDGVLIIGKDLIDKACKDKKCKKFKPNFKIEIHCIDN